MPNHNSIASLDREDRPNVSGVVREQKNATGLENLSDVHVLARNSIGNVHVSPLRFDEIRFPGKQQLSGMRPQTQEEIGGMHWRDAQVLPGSEAQQRNHSCSRQENAQFGSSTVLIGLGCGTCQECP